MSVDELSEGQKANIKKYVVDFKEFVKNDIEKEWLEEREKRIITF